MPEVVVVLFFDRRTYMVFAPGQLVVRQDIDTVLEPFIA